MSFEYLLCVICKNKLDENSNFCSICGHKVQSFSHKAKGNSSKANNIAVLAISSALVIFFALMVLLGFGIATNQNKEINGSDRLQSQEKLALTYVQEACQILSNYPRLTSVDAVDRERVVELSASAAGTDSVWTEFANDLYLGYFKNNGVWTEDRILALNRVSSQCAIAGNM